MSDAFRFSYNLPDFTTSILLSDSEKFNNSSYISKVRISFSFAYNMIISRLLRLNMAYCSFNLWFCTTDKIYSAAGRPTGGKHLIFYRLSAIFLHRSHWYLPHIHRNLFCFFICFFFSLSSFFSFLRWNDTKELVLFLSISFLLLFFYFFPFSSVI